MTEKLFESDSYCREFTATVLSCVQDGESYKVVLDRTAFFPEGGGQAADKGKINGIAVLDVQTENDKIVHTLEACLPEGQTVTGEIDWSLRYSRMQSHTGEHVLSGIVYTLFGYSNAGFHMSESSMTVDFSGPLTKEDIEKIEWHANQAIYKNAEIKAYYPTDEELATLNYRSKVEHFENTRIVAIGDIDCCACCAPHLKRTGEIGIIKILDFMPHKQGTRVEIVAGVHALKDYFDLSNATKGMMKMLSAPRFGIEEAVREQISAITELRNENQKLSKKLAWYELNPTFVGNSAFAIANGLSYDDLRYCANTLLEKGHSACILLSANDENGYIYVVSGKEDVSTLVKSLNSAFEGRGGGKNNYAQGKISACDKQTLTEFLENTLNA